MSASKKGLEQESQADKSEEDSNSETEKARAEAKAAHAKSKAEEKARIKVEKALTEAQEALAVAQAEAEHERQTMTEAEQARDKAEKALAEAKKALQNQKELEKALSDAQEALEVAVANVEQEKEIRIEAEKAKAEAENALADALKDLQNKKEAKKDEPSPVELEDGSTEQRITFVVRLTVDERGKTKRTEIEHPQSGQKKIYPSLDVQQLTDFMKMCIIPRVHHVNTDSSSSELPNEKATAPEIQTSATSLIVPKVDVYRVGAPGVSTLNVDSDESFVIQAVFQLEGLEAQLLVAQESPYEIRIHLQDITRGSTKLLETHTANLVKGLYEYSAQIEVQGLSPGRYRLLTLVMFPDPIKIMAHYDGPVFKVTDAQPSVKPIVSMEVSLPQ